MPATRMESRLEQIETDLGKLPMMETKVTTLSESIEKLQGMMEEGFRAMLKLKGVTQPPIGESSASRTSEVTGGDQIGESTPPEVLRGDRLTTEMLLGKVRRLELPVFDGTDPDSWLFWAERYFQINRFTDKEKVEAAWVCMEGKALSWFQWVEARVPFRCWADLKVMILQRFRDTQSGSLQERFLAIRQDSTVEAYREKFEVMSFPLKNVTEETLEAVFINGLKQDIQAEVRMQNPRSLLHMMELAKRVEDRNSALKKAKEKDPPRRVRMITTSPQRVEQRVVNWNPQRQLPTAEKSRNPLPFRKLTGAEVQARREKGLCFRCDEKYTIGHRCKNRELHVILVNDLEEEEPDDEPGEEQEQTTEDSEVVSAELSLNSVVGLTSTKTMKIRGKMAEQEVIVLIDCGATHNFINSELVERLQLPISETSSYGVVMGTGVAVKGKGVCKGVVLSLQSLTVVEDFLPLELGSSDIILGMQWLSSLVPCKLIGRI